MTREINRHNILWIGVDQMRSDDLNGSACKTPNLDSLASTSTNFTRAYSPSSLCTPARGSMFTGLYAFNHGMGTNCDMYHSLAAELPNPRQLLHTRLQAAGYRTGFTGKWHVGTTLGPSDYGFEGMSIPGYGDLREDLEYRRYLSQNGLSYGPVKNPIYANKNSQTMIAGEWNGPVESSPTHYLTSYTIDLLEEYARSYKKHDQPFILTCQYWAPHGPFLPAPEYVGRHDRAGIEPWLNWPDDYKGKPRRFRRLVNSFFAELPNSWQKWQALIGLGYDYVLMVDEQIGRLLTALEDLGLSNDTMVIFTSDHGDMRGSHGLQDKGYMYEEAHRIPLIARLPGQTEARECKELVYNMDIFPTILDALGIEGGKLDGESFLPLLKSDNATGRDSVYLEFHGIRYLRTERGLVTREGLKYIFNPADDDELYDLNRDPGEMTNLLVYGDNRADSLRELLIQTAKEHGDPVRDCISKWFGRWGGTSGQPDVSSRYETDTEVPQ